MKVSPLVPIVDVSRFCIAVLLLRYVTKMEQNCRNSKLPFRDWRSVLIRLYCLLTFIFIIVSLFMKPNQDLMTFQVLINGPLGLFVLVALYTYVRDLEEEIKKCDVSRDIKYLHEFWKFYSLISMILILFMVFIVISSVISMFGFPKHVAIQKLVDDIMEEQKKSRISSKSKSSNKSKSSGKSKSSRK